LPALTGFQTRLIKMNSLFSGYRVSTIGLLLGLSSMGFAVGYLQMHLGLMPCNLCVLDRGVVISLCAVFALALIYQPSEKGRKVYATVATLLSATGIAICARHIWLQNLPEGDIPECGPGFWYMLETMPFSGFLHKIFNASGQCADIQGTFLGLSIPEWTLALFVVFLILSLIMFFTRARVRDTLGHA